MRQPQIWIIAGPNGSGKTSLVNKLLNRFKKTIPFINPDAIAEKINPNNLSIAAISAGRKAIEQQEEYLKEKESFAIQTTLSGNREIRLLERAKN